VLTALPTQHCDTMAQAGPRTSAPRVQEFLPTMPWDAEDLNQPRGQKLMADAPLGAGVLVLDAPGFPTPGKTSVGGARQDSGTLGQGGHSEMAVTWCDTAPQATGPVAVRWYVPTAWAEEPERRRKARGSETVTFQPPPAIALGRREQAWAWGVPHRGVVAAADDGDHPHLLAGLEARQASSGVGVRADVRGSLQRRATSPRADQRRQALPRGPWRPSRQGGRRQQVGAVRGGRVTSDGRRRVGWLWGERATRGQPAARPD
jgi:SRSO17 transposase